MTTVKEAAERLEAAAKTVADVRAYRDLSATIDPPGVVIGPPRITFEGYSPGEPTSATFPVYVVVKLDDRTLEELWELVPKVAAALAEVADAVEMTADPGVFPAGGSDLPAYEITVEVSL